MNDPEGYSIETVRGRLAGTRAEQVMAFWSRLTNLSEAAAVERLRHVVCVLLDDQGEIAGVNSAVSHDVKAIAGRTFWIYRSLLDPAVPAEAGDRMLTAAFSILEAEFTQAGEGPLGVCLLIPSRAERERRPEAEWKDPRILYAGYLPDGAQVRIGYFEGAKIGPGSGGLGSMADPDPELSPGYRISTLAGAEGVSEQDVIDFWQREGAVFGPEAERRIREVLLVGVDEAGSVAGVSSAYIWHNPDLGLDLWYYRAFVSEAHRSGNLAVRLALIGRDQLEEQYVSGADTRAAGIVYEVENEGLKRYFNDATWRPTDFTFIGENERGAHVRVRYFPGAMAPDPPPPAALY